MRSVRAVMPGVCSYYVSFSLVRCTLFWKVHPPDEVGKGLFTNFNTHNNQCECGV